ncbi:MAG: hypothetical protein WCE49_07470, partial [Terrimicrobiaceae bacterium]
EIPRQTVRDAQGIGVSQMRREKMLRTARQLVERMQERAQRPAFFYGWTARCGHKVRHFYFAW